MTELEYEKACRGPVLIGTAPNWPNNTTGEGYNYRGSGDGFDIRTLDSTSLSGQSFAPLYGGGGQAGYGDGFDSLTAFGIIVVPVFDTDGDGMPDDWEDLYVFLNFKDSTDASLDFDRDGFSNLDEYLADTDPSSPLSFFKVDIRELLNGDYEIFFDTKDTRYYFIQISESLSGWKAFGQTFQGINGEYRITLPDPSGRIFSRVGVSPTP